jgi:hypothetical protein
MSQATISDLDFVHAASLGTLHVSGGSSPYSTSYSVDSAAGYNIKGPDYGYSVNRQSGSYYAYTAGGYSAGVSGSVAGAIAVGGTTYTYANATVITS